MQVIATRKGYYDNIIRNEGEEFTVPDDTVISDVAWFQPVAQEGDEDTAPKVKRRGR